MFERCLTRLLILKFTIILSRTPRENNDLSYKTQENFQEPYIYMSQENMSQNSFTMFHSLQHDYMRPICNIPLPT